MSGQSRSPFPRIPVYLLSLAVLIAYYPALRGGAVWDDGMYVFDNPNMENWEGLSNIWIDPLSSPNYYPMTFTSFWLEHRLWQGDPRGYHLTNVLLHIANSVLLYLLLTRLAVPWALFAAALFAVHPIHVESVAWIAERKNVLSMFFGLIALLAWFRWEEEQDGRFLFHVYLAFIAAILTKTVACVLPVALLTLVAGRNPSRIRTAAIRTLPMFVLSLVLGAVTIWWERTRMGAAEAAADLSFLDRLLAAGTIPWFYIQKTLIPIALYPIYPAWNLEPSNPVQWILPILTAVTLLFLWTARRRIGTTSFLLAGLYLVLLGPSLGFIDHSTMDLSLVADHYFYHASPVVMVAIVLAGAGLLRRLEVEPSTLQPRAVAAVLASLCVLTFLHAQVYANSESLWRHGLKGNPDSWAVRTNYGAALMENEKFAEALEQYQAAVKLRPDHLHLKLNVGDAYMHLGEMDKARETYLSTLEFDPNFAVAHYKVGRLEQGRERFEEAEAALKRAIEMDPEYQEAHNSLGVLYAMNGRLDDAMIAFQQVLLLNPDHKGAYRNLMTAFLEREGALPSPSGKGGEKKPDRAAAAAPPPAASGQALHD